MPSLLPTIPGVLEQIKENTQLVLEEMTGIDWHNLDNQPDLTNVNNNDTDPIGWVSIYAGSSELESSSRGRIYNPFLHRSVNYQIELVLSFVGNNIDILDNHVLRWLDFVSDKLEYLARDGEAILHPSKTLLKGFRVDSFRKVVQPLGTGIEPSDRTYSIKLHILCSKHRN